MRPILDQENAQAISIWNLMGGIEWAALPALVTICDVADPEGLIRRLTVIRNHLA